jgi:spermidine/putrescine transport system ATP-binding protein
MDGMEDKSVTKLSGGQAQRVALARALAARPEVLLLDEPLSALDLKLRHAMQLELRRIHEASGTTFIFVTHDQGEALAMSDRVILMRDGEIVQDGRPQDLYDQPSTPFASDFLGAANLVEGVVGSLAGDSAHLEVGVLQLPGRATVPLSAGDEAVLSIRPERIEVVPGDRTDPGAVTGVIERTVFLGHIVRCIVRLDGCDARLTAEGTRAAGADWEAGLTVSVAWAPADAHVMTR